MHAWFLSNAPILGLVLSAVLLLALGFVGAPGIAWTLGVAALAVLWGAPIWAVAAIVVVGAVLSFPPIRRSVATRPIMGIMRALKFLPVISDTEREALEAGTVWADGELFSGRPDVDRLVRENYPELTEEERAFLDGATERVCELCDDWDVMQRRDLPPAVWRALKDEGFFGLLIPKEYGGLGFSAEAKSRIIAKLSSRSGTLGITVMVPNSLGPAELLLHHGTQEQRDHWLPRLARGEEIPCFALTEPNAGSDAGSMTSRGEVFKGDDGELYLRLNWSKRYITLAAISTVLGMAFKLKDPENLLGQGTDLGITCALVPSDAPGVVLGRRHDPLGVPFYNCPTTGEDVIVPVAAIIGGAAGAGRGWQMLMEALSAGRGIALPSSSTATAKNLSRIAGAYSTVRQQFGLSIGNFEGIAEPLARLGSSAYVLEAARRFTCGAIDAGQKPAVVTAMAKYSFTETNRRCINDAMDVLGGAAISRGPRNLVAHAYYAAPISITVEGANILTRTLMIFGQGAVRSHPFAYREIVAMEKNDVQGFDAAFWGHVGHVIQNTCRAKVMWMTRGLLASSPVEGPTSSYWKRLGWVSSTFATLADFSMAGLGGELKRREALTGRFADIFVEMYLITAVLRRFEADGRPTEDLPFVRFSLDSAFGRIQQSFEGLCANLSIPFVGWIFKYPVRFWLRVNPMGRMPGDEATVRVADLLQKPGAQRERLFGELYLSDDPSDALRRLESAFEACVAAAEPTKKVKRAMRSKKLERGPLVPSLDRAVELAVITSDEAETIRAAEAARDDAIQVDDFTLDEYLRTAHVAEGGAEGQPAA